MPLPRLLQHLRRLPSAAIQHQVKLQHHLFRPFFSFLKWEDNNRHCEHASTQSTDLARKMEQKVQQDTNHRMSLQHAHPLGPWQAILKVVQKHHANWLLQQNNNSNDNDDGNNIDHDVNNNPFRVLDLACGPRGQPGTTIAHALPSVAVHCTDSCPIAIAAVLVASDHSTPELDDESDSAGSRNPPPPPPPTNLSKSVHDLTDLGQYGTDTVHVIVCCYGYGLSDDVSQALAEAHRVLVRGGILVICTWERSALLMQGNRTLSWVHGRDDGNGDDDNNNNSSSSTCGDVDAAFLVRDEVPVLALSGVGEFEGLLVGAGFDHPGAVVTTFGTYPFDLGRQTDHQFAMGTLLIRKELERLGAFHPSGGGGHWRNLAEEAFWINIGKYTDIVDGSMMLRDNTFKLTTSTKRH